MSNLTEAGGRTVKINLSSLTHFTLAFVYPPLLLFCVYSRFAEKYLQEETVKQNLFKSIFAF